MQIDLHNNELNFRQVTSPADFAKLLERGKDLEFRRYGTTFYVSLEHFQVARQVLKGTKERISFSVNYEKFAHLFVLNKKPIHIDWYPAECRISGTGVPWHKIIPATRYFDKAALNAQSYARGQWDGHRNLFDVVNGKFPSGLLERILGILNQENVPFTINRTFDYPAPVFQLNPVFEFVPTDDQIKAVEALAKANNGIAKLPTGFGKTSYVAAALIAKKGVRSMFLANQRVLISDAKKDFQSVFRNDDVHIGTIGDGEFDLGDITVASIQSIKAALEPPTQQDVAQVTMNLERARMALRAATGDDATKLEKEIRRLEGRISTLKFQQRRSATILPYLKSVQLFIVDESQVLGTAMWDKFLHACPAPYRYTLSATDTRSDGGRIQIVAATGERRYESSAAEQIEKGRLAEFQGKFMVFDHGIPKSLAKELRIVFHQAYRFFIVNNEVRNSHLCDKVIEYAKAGSSVLALITLLDHADIVRDMLIAKGMPEWTMEIVHGETPKKVREDRIDRYRKGEFPILIGSSIFDVGFNAKNASRMVRFNAGASEVREPQRAGRTVRKREDNSHGETYDIIDTNVPYFENQGWKRYKLLREEFGHQRAKVLPGCIEGHADIVALREIVAEIPDETDREQSEKIIAQLLMGREAQENVGNDAEELYDKLAEDPDLKSILEELRFDGTI